jgi:hypothetical protein
VVHFPDKTTAHVDRCREQNDGDDRSMVGFFTASSPFTNAAAHSLSLTYSLHESFPTHTIRAIGDLDRETSPLSILDALLCHGRTKQSAPRAVCRYKWIGGEARRPAKPRSKPSIHIRHRPRPTFPTPPPYRQHPKWQTSRMRAVVASSP